MARAYENFLRKLGFKEYNYVGEYKHVEIMKREADAKSRKILDEFFSDNDTSDVAFYNIKNETLKFSDLYSSVVDGHIFKEIFKFIEGNKKCFGNKILDLGCDNGLVTCFLAYLFPNSEIIGVDRTSNFKAICEERAKKLKLHNVKFINANEENYKNEKYDSIFTSRILYYNLYEEKVEPKTSDDYEGMLEKFARSMGVYGTFISELKEILNEDGYILQFERLSKPMEIAQWLYTYSHLDFSRTMFDYKVIREGGDKFAFTFSIVQNNKNNIFSDEECLSTANGVIAKEKKLAATKDGMLFSTRFIQLLPEAENETYNVYMNGIYSGNICYTKYSPQRIITAICDLDNEEDSSVGSTTFEGEAEFRKDFEDMLVFIKSKGYTIKKVDFQ